MVSKINWTTKKKISKDTHFIEISAEESEARNVRIQGTQADFIKELLCY
jgi:L-ribulose-5-phosphate 3-epimerase UlaE